MLMTLGCCNRPITKSYLTYHIIVCMPLGDSDILEDMRLHIFVSFCAIPEETKLPFCSFASVPDSVFQTFSAIIFLTFVSFLLALCSFHLNTRESEYAAWTLVNGYALNHATVSTHRLESDIRSISKFNKFVEESGFKLNTEGGILKGMLLIFEPLTVVF